MCHSGSNSTHHVLVCTVCHPSIIIKFEISIRCYLGCYQGQQGCPIYGPWTKTGLSGDPTRSAEWIQRWIRNLCGWSVCSKFRCSRIIILSATMRLSKNYNSLRGQLSKEKIHELLVLVRKRKFVFTWSWEVGDAAVRASYLIKVSIKSILWEEVHENVHKVAEVSSTWNTEAEMISEIFVLYIYRAGDNATLFVIFRGVLASVWRCLFVQNNYFSCESETINWMFYRRIVHQI